MRAKVKVINPQKGMYGAEIEGSGEYVVFELLDSAEPELGDEISHSDFYAMGGETLRNRTQGCSIDVFIQNVCDESNVRKCCLF